MLRLAEAFETAKVPLVPLVPQIQLSGGEGGNAFGTLQALMFDQGASAGKAGIGGAMSTRATLRRDFFSCA